jgi:hypothetical protein
MPRTCDHYLQWIRQQHKSEVPVMLTFDRLQPLATFCGGQNCCPQLFVDQTAAADRRIVLTDDFGAQVRMSAAQFGDLVSQAKSGTLDKIV